MRSHLTRRVFRAIIANQPYCHAAPLRESSYRTIRPRRQLLSNSPHRRSLFGRTSQPWSGSLLTRQPTAVDLEVATDTLISLAKAQRDSTPVPSVEKVVHAFKVLLQARGGVGAMFSRTEAHLLTKAFGYIQAHEADTGGEVDTSLKDEDMQQGLSSLASSLKTESFRTDLGSLARSIYTELKQRAGQSSKGDGSPAAPSPETSATYAAVLSSSGSSREAWELLKNTSAGQHQQNWSKLIRGLCNEGLDAKTPEVLNDMRTRSGALTMENQEALLLYLTRVRRPSIAKLIYEQPLDKGTPPTLASQIAMSKSSIGNEDMSWAKATVSQLCLMKDEPLAWDIILVAAAADGADLSIIAALLDELSRIAAQKNLPPPTISNFNGLIEYAFSIGDVQAVQSYLQLAEKRGLQPSAETFLIQLNYELQTGQLEKAETSYTQLSSEDPVADNADLPILNRFVAALCFSTNPKYDLIMRIVDSLTDRKASLDPEAISGLCKVFLQRDEMDEALDLLQDHADSYSLSDRLRISEIFKEFILKESTPTQRAFNAYELYRSAFQETSIPDRLLIMQSFFARKRPDLACLVFGHMRQREDKIARPTAEAYGQCFEGIARCQDIEGLQMVYNMLKLDREVEPDTRIRNGLMAAYTACGQPFNSMIDHYWKILSSQEGPTMSTFALALRACEVWVPQGALEARKIIAMMQDWNLEITKEIYDSYLGAIAGQCEFENSIELIEEMEGDLGISPDAFTIGTFYNAIPWQWRKDEVEAWAKKTYPELWAEVVSYGDYIDEDWDIRYYKLDRTIDTSDDPIFGDGDYQPQIARSTQGLLNAPL